MTMSKRPRTTIRISPKANIVSSPSIRKVEVYRYLRVDAEPNWSQRVREREGEIMTIASRPPVTITFTSPIISAVELMHKRRVRGLVVVDARGALKGTVTAMDFIGYLGGPSYNIVQERHGGDIYKALNSETVESIMNPTPVYILINARITDALRVMVLNGIGFLPIIDKQGLPQGVVTEHDLVRHLVNKEISVKVTDVMTSNLVVAYSDDSIKRAAQLMSLYGFRRLPVVSREEGTIVGVVSALDIVSYFGSHAAFSVITGRSMEEALSTKVAEVMSKEVYTIRDSEDVGTAAELMNKLNTNSLIVIDEAGEAKGIITERDVLLALALR
jgi:CBS domain-containing protein